MRPEAEIEPYSPAFRWQYPLALGFAKFLMAVLGWFETVGKENVPKTGGLLILSNHRSDCDPVAIQVACPRPIRFMAKSELFEMKGVSLVLRWLRCFPVKRGEPDRNAIKHAVALLQAGHAVCIFPEGQLTETGFLQELKPGIALIARMADVPTICVGLRKTEKIVPYHKLTPRPAFTQVSAHWGAPRHFDRKAETEEILQWAEAEFRRLTNEPKLPT